MTLRMLFFLGAITCGAGTAAAQTTTTNAAPAVPAAPANPYPLALAPAEIIGKSEAVLALYPAPSAPPTADPVELEITEKVTELGPDLQIFSDETARLLAKNPSLDRIRSLQNLGKYLAGYPASWTADITGRTAEVSNELGQIDGEQKTWTDTEGALAHSTATTPPEISRRVSEVMARLDSVRQQAEATQASLLSLESRVQSENARLTDAMNKLALARERAIGELFERNAPPVWAGVATPESARTDDATWPRQEQSLKAYVAAEPGKFAIHGALLALLTLFFYWLRGYARKWTAEEPGIRLASGIFETPLATAGLLSLIASPLLYYPIAPRLLSAILGAVALVPSVILLRRLIEPRLFPILNALVIFFLLEEVRSVATWSPGYGRVFFLAEILGAIVFLVWLLLSLRRAESPVPPRRFGRATRLGALAALALLIAAWAANILGYVLLGNLLGEAVQRSATLALALYAGVRIVDAILFIMSRLRPLSTLGIVRLHGPMLLERIDRILAWIASAIWILYTLELFSLGTPVFGWIRTFLTAYDANHHLVLTPAGKILAALVIGWGAFQLSKFARFVLQTDFYPRLHLSAGIPYAISTSLHYAMLVVAFIGATYVLGIDMTKFTILVSALGVGVGFGLQNIINNFVSGIILLFERPVKIGDSIQSGDATGVVERIGIRASVLRTTNGSEMIVPNGNLISNSVTNWTLSTRERIIIIPFNVTRGPDVARLMDLLASIAASHSKVLKDPAPQVLVLTLGAALGFELRAWTTAVEDWTVVRSELALAINSALTRENIALA
jgi:potassium efflux system protein